MINSMGTPKRLPYMEHQPATVREYADTLVLAGNPFAAPSTIPFLMHSGNTDDAVQAAADSPVGCGGVTQTVSLPPLEVPLKWQTISLKPGSILHPSLWARRDLSTPSGFGYVWFDTELSTAIQNFQQFSFAKLPSSRSRPKQFRSMQHWFNILKEIMQIPLVAQLLMLFERGFLPATMAALLGEKERAAAFAEKHPLAWIDIYPPVLASIVKFVFASLLERGMSVAMDRIVVGSRLWLTKQDFYDWCVEYYCEHGNLRKNDCTICKGSVFCEHGRRKSQCTLCKGSSICKHGRRKSRCTDCKKET